MIQRMLGPSAKDALHLRYKQFLTAPLVIWNRFARGKKEIHIPPDRDFGNLIHKGPQTLRVASNTRQVQDILREANRSGTRVHVMASGHSSNGQTLSDPGGWRLKLSAEGFEPATLLDGHRVEAPAPMRWADLEALLTPHGRTCTVLTDTLSTTLGGTISVGGGIGPRSFKHGRQLDAVERLRVVLPTGDPVWCSPDENAELFRNVIGGLGQLGVIDRVVLRTCRHRPFTVLWRFQHASLREAAQAAYPILTEGILPKSASQYQIVGPMLNTDFVESTWGFDFCDEQEARAFKANLPDALKPLRRHLFQRKLCRNIALKNQARSAPFLAAIQDWIHLWNDWFFADFSDYVAFLGYLEEDLLRNGLRSHLTSCLCLGVKKLEDRPQPLLDVGPGSAPDKEPCAYSVGVVFDVPRRYTEIHERIRVELQKALARAHALNGRLYPHGYFAFDAAMLKEIGGRRWDELVALKHKLDPDHILNPGVLPIPPPSGR